MPWTALLCLSLLLLLWHSVPSQSPLPRPGLLPISVVKLAAIAAAAVTLALVPIAIVVKGLLIVPLLPIAAMVLTPRCPPRAKLWRQHSCSQACLLRRHCDFAR